MVRGNMGYDHTIAWGCPINGKGIRAERRGRGYPEGLVRSPISTPPRTQKVAPYLDQHTVRP